MMDLEMMMKNVWMGSYRLFINVARYSLENEEKKVSRENMEKKGPGKTVHQGNNEHSCRRFYNYASNSISYAGIVSGSHQKIPKQKEIVVSEFIKAFDDLHEKDVVSRVKDLWSLRKLDVS
ncbi:hypothetical protein Hanom_Chr05g00450201 [Helianthus anomalus]